MPNLLIDHDGKYKNFKLEDTGYSGCTNENYQTEDEYFSCLQNKAREDVNKKDYDGKRAEKEALNSNVQESTESYYWPKNGVQYSEYIEICHRNPLTFGNLFGDIDFNVREKDTGYEGGSWSPRVDGKLECKVLKAGQSETIHGSIIFLKSIGNHFRLLLNPGAGNRVKFNGKTLENDEVHSVFIFFAIFMLTFTISSIVMSYLSNADFITSISSVSATLTNSGPGFSNLIGPSGNYSSFSNEVKLFLSFLMLLGRLEILPIYFCIGNLFLFNRKK